MPPTEIIVHLADAPKGWTEYVELATNLLGPILTFIFGFLVLKVTKRIEHSQWRNQKLIEKRIQVWDDLAPQINDIYCYCRRVGKWKDVSPKEVVKWKRDVDRKIHINKPFFTDAFFSAYMNFESGCFATFQGHGIDAKIRSPVNEHQYACSIWEPGFEDCFSDEPISEEELDQIYYHLQDQISVELNVKEEA